ncbi:MAG: glycosyltransferase family 4 protein [Patescibacteria group bacterium]|jgi:glycosyltransferase involved in cell wall biosynthesis
MKIAMLAPFEEPVPPKKYGGTERVVHFLTEELVRRGHDVTLVATGDSITSAKIKPVFSRSLRSDPLNVDPKVRDTNKFIGLGRALEYLTDEKFDIVHNHLGWRLLPFLKLIDAPVVNTLHGPLGVAHQQSLYRAYADASYISISQSQRKPLPQLNYVANVYNGTRVEEFDYQGRSGDYYVFLGRMSPEKGPVQAINLAKQAGVKLIMAAKVDQADTKFFEREVAPLIDGNQIEFIGEVDHGVKNKLLGGAKALLAPIQWEEPFGLYFIEALACGTPVIAYKRGSTPEVIRNGETGYVCTTPEEMLRKMYDVEGLERRTCRDDVSMRFSTESMASGYLGAYQMALGEQG